MVAGIDRRVGTVVKYIAYLLRSNITASKVHLNHSLLLRAGTSCDASNCYFTYATIAYNMLTCSDFIQIWRAISYISIATYAYRAQIVRVL
jgi:hypothetical protein